MDKDEFIKVLKSVNITVNEGIQNDKSTDYNPRIVFFEYLWEPFMASGKEYNTKVTYQVSFFSNISRDKKLVELKKAFKSKGINPIIEHEYVEADRCFHSFFPVEVLENIE